MYEINEVDCKIVDLLMEDGRMNAAEIARRMGGELSERAIRYRINRLLEEGVIKISAIPNPSALGFTVVADVFVEVEPALISEVAHTLAENEQVSYVACSIGERDISAQIIARDITEVYAFATEVIGRLPGVRKTTTSIVPIRLKDVYEWRIPHSVRQAKPDQGKE